MTLSYSPLSPNDAARSFYPKMHKHYPRISTEWLGQGYGIISKWDSIWHATVPLLCWSKRREKETQDREEKKVDQNPCRRKGRSLFPIFNWEKGPCHIPNLETFFPSSLLPSVCPERGRVSELFVRGFVIFISLGPRVSLQFSPSFGLQQGWNQHRKKSSKENVLTK